MKMKKTVYLILALVMAALLALPFARGTAAVSAQELQAALAPAAEEEGMKQKDEGQLCTLLQIRSDAYEEAVYFGAPSYMDVEEIIILYSPSHKGELLEKMQEHIERQITAFKGYGEQQTRMLEKAEVSVIGNYAVCVVSGSSELMQTVRAALR